MMYFDLHRTRSELHYLHRTRSELQYLHRTRSELHYLHSLLSLAIKKNNFLTFLQYKKISEKLIFNT